MEEKELKCNKCDYILFRNYDHYMYVEDENSKRIICPHPIEDGTIYGVLGKDASDELVDEKTGLMSFCVCLDCLHQFELDLRKDKNCCLKCKSSNIKSVYDFEEVRCPKCKEGMIVKRLTGFVS